MARNKGKYYVQKTWEGGRCVSRYIGAGPLAEDLEELDALARERRELERKARREERERERKLDAQVKEAGELARALTAAVLLVSGYHTHKGQWRKRRE